METKIRELREAQKMTRVELDAPCFVGSQLYALWLVMVGWTGFEPATP